MDKKQKRNLGILGLLVAVGITYNIYLIFKPEEIKEKTEIIQTDGFKDAFNELGINDSTLLDLSHDNESFQAFLDSADVILKDSMNCNCPDRYKKGEENEKL